MIRLKVLCYLAALLFWSGELNAEVQKGALDNGDDALVEIVGLHLEEFGELGLTVELWSPRAIYSRKDKLLNLGEVRVVVLSSSGVSPRTTEMKAREGRADLEEMVIFLRGDVRIVTDDGYELNTQEATYDYEAREVEGAGEVYLTGPEGMTRGEGAHLWLDDEVVLLRRSVQTILKPEAIQKAKVSVKR